MRLPYKGLGLVVLVLTVAGFLALLGLGLANRAPVTGKSGVTRVGKPAPEFTLPLLTGEELDLSQHRGQPIVINFWSSWCPPCRDEAPLLEAVWRSYRGEGVLFVGVDIQDADEDARAYIREFDITYPNGADRDGKVTVDYGVIGLPVTFFVNKKGIVERRWVGAIRESRLVAWVEELIAGLAPTGEPEGEDRDRFFQLN